MTIDRRGLISAGAGFGVLAVGVAAGSARADSHQTLALKAGAQIGSDRSGSTRGIRADLVHGSELNQTKALQRTIDRAARDGVGVELPPGRFVVGNITLREGTVLVGAHGHTTLAFSGGASFIVGESVNGVRIESLIIDGQGTASELVALRSCRDVVLSDVVLRRAVRNGIGLSMCSGRISGCEVSQVGEAGIFSLDALGLEISGNRVSECGNNGILVWRSKTGEDGSVVSGNRIFDILARDGGSGENGNGVNVFRAGGVIVSSNRITDCAYSAVRGNGASNIQIVGNSCARIGEVALYAEFGFQGAVISSNLVDTAACGISVTNFNKGGRLAVIQGNLVRNLFRREHEVQDKRGEGITVEADASVTGNTIEGAASVGLGIGWGKHMRDVVATGNVIRSCPVGIGISSDKAAGACLVSQNLVSGARDGSIKAMKHGRAHGPELASGNTQTERVSISGNLAV